MHGHRIEQKPPIQYLGGKPTDLYRPVYNQRVRRGDTKDQVEVLDQWYTVENTKSQVVDEYGSPKRFVHRKLAQECADQVNDPGTPDLEQRTRHILDQVSAGDMSNNTAIAQLLDLYGYLA